MAKTIRALFGDFNYSIRCILFNRSKGAAAARMPTLELPRNQCKEKERNGTCLG